MNQEEQWLLEEKYKGTESEAFRSDLARLQAGEPLGYLIGSVPFLNCTIHLDSHPLIPRVETEFWTEKAIAEIKRINLPTPHVLDLCAGSGAIGVAIVKTIPEAQVTFAEIDPSHLPTIQNNLMGNLSAYSNRLEYAVVESDLFENIESTFDFILTNPPYIDPQVDRAEPSVKMHEPHVALYGGAGGMECIEKIINQAPAHLNKGGQLWIEHEPEQSTSIQELADKAGFTCSTHTDQYNVERYSTLVLQ